MQPLQVVSLGIESPAVLSRAAYEAIKQADHIVGSARQFDMVTHLDLPARQHLLPRPLDDLGTLLRKLKGQVALLASGDALFYGIGNTLKMRWPDITFVSHPNISSVQALAHRLQENLHELTTISLHGRPLSRLYNALVPGRQLALLTDGNTHPLAIAEYVSALGWQNVRCAVGERLGYPEERVTQWDSLNALIATAPDFDALNVVWLALPDRAPEAWARTALTDTQYQTDHATPGQGMLTKQEVRQQVLAMLDPNPTETGWDIGAGCGGVSIEWARRLTKGYVHAIEHHPERFDALATNQGRFGLDRQLVLHDATATASLLATLPDPTVVFIGGSDGALDDLLEQVWERLPVGGRLIASGVTEPSQACLTRFEGQHGLDGHWCRIDISRGSLLGGQRLLRPRLPVTLVRFIKPDQPTEQGLPT
ncbi:precorrin-6y C5,15-methyltransferase (decarboxylating) subunit CbiE [Larsenimonas rhizosphaerae]|uniref:Precorrin-6y C5,15-methyltransferase (Decarboxylating) subunit CbiE n=1 Tax=Larsenimonas rhizosphaerae TaxID=2944682 RepID=A0AA41ZFF9_9GAMM|nr:precorrin-6y C5,15-methyltransferase (decarboxylating) subunit CbiE [Larsenimonas rhizosphaerae]MCX2523184.1 precorrin-6y C5,15-methyltransferase (decarboxylating) subunit CbiE [Larsenimonas rhizosphaerae]